MGKIDDMRRQREARFEADQRTLAAKPRTPPAAPTAGPPVAGPPTVTAAPAPRAGALAEVDEPDLDGDEDGDAPAGDATTGVCSACGKVKPLQGDKVAPHQKGLGKACPGSRKPPR
ncbi:MAG: hypothetical protein R3B06_08140 [Kofleriaceae bacterium]